MALKKLGVVKEIVESVGMNIGHAYEDLVFLDHNGFLLQFDEDPDTVIIHCNREAEEKILSEATNILKGAAADHGMSFVDGDDYLIIQEDDENLRIDFFEKQ